MKNDGEGLVKLEVWKNIENIRKLRESTEKYGTGRGEVGERQGKVGRCRAR